MGLPAAPSPVFPVKLSNLFGLYPFIGVIVCSIAWLYGFFPSYISVVLDGSFIRVEFCCCTFRRSFLVFFFPASLLLFALLLLVLLFCLCARRTARRTLKNIVFFPGSFLPFIVLFRCFARYPFFLVPSRRLCRVASSFWVFISPFPLFGPVLCLCFSSWLVVHCLYKSALPIPSTLTWP